MEGESRLRKEERRRQKMHIMFKSHVWKRSGRGNGFCTFLFTRSLLWQMECTAISVIKRRWNKRGGKNIILKNNLKGKIFFLLFTFPFAIFGKWSVVLDDPNLTDNTSRQLNQACTYSRVWLIFNAICRKRDVPLLYWNPIHTPVSPLFISGKLFLSRDTLIVRRTTWT